MARNIETVVIGTRHAGTSTLFSLTDVLASVGRDWEMLHGLDADGPRFSTSLRTLDGAPYWDVNGRKITPDALLGEAPRPDLVIVPDLHVDPGGDVPPDLAPVAAWIATAHAGGAIVTSVCSGAILIGAAGLLDGREATTHWGYGDMLARLFPNVTVRRERILVPAGEGHRIVTAGGASAWADLVLYMVGRLAGAEAARRIAKLYLLEPHDRGQLHYASLTAGRQHQDQMVAEAQRWLADNYAVANPVSAMAGRSGLTNRGFHRRFRLATGQTPSDYVQTLRIEEAKHMLEKTDAPVEAIAEEAGYAEPSSFRAAFRRRVGISASAYRRKWRSMRHLTGCFPGDPARSGDRVDPRRTPLRASPPRAERRAPHVARPATCGRRSTRGPRGSARRACRVEMLRSRTRASPRSRVKGGGRSGPFGLEGGGRERVRPTRWEATGACRPTWSRTRCGGDGADPVPLSGAVPSEDVTASGCSLRA
ncbi:MAG: GlxA family transcriptional regulator [Paracoccaceae bacterium]